MSRWIERALDVQPGDLRNGVLLSSCLFLTISAAVIGKVASNRRGRFEGHVFPAEVVVHRNGAKAYSWFAVATG